MSSDRGLELFPESFLVGVLLSVSLVSVVLQKTPSKCRLLDILTKSFDSYLGVHMACSVCTGLTTRLGTRESVSSAHKSQRSAQALYLHLCCCYNSDQWAIAFLQLSTCSDTYPNHGCHLCSEPYTHIELRQHTGLS